MGLFGNKLVIATSVVFSATWFALACLYPDHWNTLHNASGHGPTEWKVLPLAEYSTRLLVGMSLVLATLCLLTLFYKAAQTCTPWFCSLTVGWGSRTLYVYVIHTTLLKCLPPWMMPNEIP